MWSEADEQPGRPGAGGPGPERVVRHDEAAERAAARAEQRAADHEDHGKHDEVGEHQTADRAGHRAREQSLPALRMRNSPASPAAGSSHAAAAPARPASRNSVVHRPGAAAASQILLMPSRPHLPR